MSDHTYKPRRNRPRPGHYSRRQLLGALGGTAAVNALSPFVPRLEAQSVPTRFIYWYTPVMPAPEFVDQNYQRNAGPLQFQNAFAPLNGVADRLLFVRGLDNHARNDMGGRSGGPHPKGGASFLLGRAAKNGQSGDDYFSGARVGPHSSLDQWLATRLKQEQGVSTLFSDLRLGFRNQGKDGNCDKTVSILNGKLRLRHQDPQSLYRELMPVVAGSGGSGMNPSDLLEQKSSVLDFVRSGVNRLRPQLSRPDQLKLDAHLQSIRAVEQRIERIKASAGSVACSVDGNLNQPNLTREDVAEDLYIKMIRQAFSCDLTRVLGAHYGPHTSTLRYDFLPQKRKSGANWHQATHRAGNDGYLNAVLSYRCAQFAKLVKTLDSVVEADGKTMLDHTVILWFSSEGRAHSEKDMFVMLAGGSHHFKLGQMVRANGAHNRVLTSVAQAMGLTVDTFGDPKYGTGALPAEALV